MNKSWDFDTMHSSSILVSMTNTLWYFHLIYISIPRVPYTPPKLSQAGTTRIVSKTSSHNNNRKPLNRNEIKFGKANNFKSRETNDKHKTVYNVYLGIRVVPLNTYSTKSDNNLSLWLYNTHATFCFDETTF